jgi:hypothetical protein
MPYSISSPHLSSSWSMSATCTRAAEGGKRRATRRKRGGGRAARTFSHIARNCSMPCSRMYSMTSRLSAHEYGSPISRKPMVQLSFTGGGAAFRASLEVQKCSRSRPEGEIASKFGFPMGKVEIDRRVNPLTHGTPCTDTPCTGHGTPCTGHTRRTGRTDTGPPHMHQHRSADAGGGLCDPAYATVRRCVLCCGHPREAILGTLPLRSAKPTDPTRTLSHGRAGAQVRRCLVVSRYRL